jgi:hypothetical protein
MERDSNLSVRNRFLRACWRNESLLEIRIRFVGEQPDETTQNDFDPIVAALANFESIQLRSLWNFGRESLSELWNVSMEMIRSFLVSEEVLTSGWRRLRSGNNKKAKI